MLINTMVETYRVFDEFSIEVPNEIKNSIVDLRQKFDEMMALVICRILNRIEDSGTLKHG